MESTLTPGVAGVCARTNGGRPGVEASPAGDATWAIRAHGSGPCEGQRGHRRCGGTSTPTCRRRGCCRMAAIRRRFRSRPESIVRFGPRPLMPRSFRRPLRAASRQTEEKEPESSCREQRTSPGSSRQTQALNARPSIAVPVFQRQVFAGPIIVPMPYVMAMARALQKVTRTTPRSKFAPPVHAANPPSNASAIKAAPATECVR